MKTVTIFLLSSLLALTGSAGVMSSYTPVAAANTNDLLLLDKQTGPATYSTKTVTVSNLFISQSATSNLSLNFFTNMANVHIAATNVSFPSGTIWGTNNSQLWLASNGLSFASWKVGDNFGGPALNYEQHRVAWVIDSTHLLSDWPATQTFLGVTGVEYSPNEVFFSDNNGNFQASIGNDGSFGVDTEAGWANSGKIFWDAQWNTIWAEHESLSDGEALGFFSATNKYKPILLLNANAPGPGLRVMADGTSSIKYGLTNAESDLTVHIYGLAETHSNVTDLATHNYLAGETISGTQTPTVTATNNTFFLAAATGNFTGLLPGDVIIPNGQPGYTIQEVKSSTVVRTVEPVTPGFTAQSCTVKYAQWRAYNSTPAPCTALSPDGKLILIDKSGQGGASQPLVFANDTTTFYVDNDAEMGYSALVFTPQGTTEFNVFSIAYETAFLGALAINQQGQCDVQYGLTNSHSAPLALLGNTTCSGNLTFPAIGNTLTLTHGSNAKIGTATANGSSAVAVATTAVTANSLIFVTEQTPAGTPGAVYVSSVTVGTGFSFKSVAGDTSTVGWLIVEKQ